MSKPEELFQFLLNALVRTQELAKAIASNDSALTTTLVRDPSTGDVYGCIARVVYTTAGGKAPGIYPICLLPDVTTIKRMTVVPMTELPPDAQKRLAPFSSLANQLASGDIPKVGDA